jgi:hypothetical protein
LIGASSLTFDRTSDALFIIDGHSTMWRRSRPADLCGAHRRPLRHRRGMRDSREGGQVQLLRCRRDPQLAGTVSSALALARGTRLLHLPISYGASARRLHFGDNGGKMVSNSRVFQSGYRAARSDTRNFELDLMTALSGI